MGLPKRRSLNDLLSLTIEDKAEQEFLKITEAMKPEEKLEFLQKQTLKLTEELKKGSKKDATQVFGSTGGFGSYDVQMFQDSSSGRNKKNSGVLPDVQSYNSFIKSNNQKYLADSQLSKASSGLSFDDNETIDLDQSQNSTHRSSSYKKPKKHKSIRQATDMGQK